MKEFEYITTTKEDYYKGIEAAISTIKWLYFNVPCDELFNGNGVEDILNIYTWNEIVSGIKEYERRINIQVGDEVLLDSGKSIGVVTCANPYVKRCYVMRWDGSSGDEEKRNVKKTGRHFPQIEEVLQQLQEGSEAK